MVVPGLLSRPQGCARGREKKQDHHILEVETDAQVRGRTTTYFYFFLNIEYVVGSPHAFIFFLRLSMWEDHHALGVFPKSASMSCCQPVHEFPDLEDILQKEKKVHGDPTTSLGYYPDLKDALEIEKFEEEGNSKSRQTPKYVVGPPRTYFCPNLKYVFEVRKLVNRLAA
jgi:hypothetical protein